MFKFRKPKRDFPEFWQDYLALQEITLDKSTPIAELEFIVFDTETSGLDFKKDVLLTIGAVRAKNNTIDLKQNYECRILHHNPFDTGAVTIHGIVPNNEKGILMEDALEEFVNYIGNSIIVGHNVGFDVKMIDQNLKLIVGDTLKNPIIDTAKLAIRIDHPHPSQLLRPNDFTLDSLCDRYNIIMHDRHTAAGDALLTSILFFKLLSKLKKRGVHTWRDLYK